MASLTVISSSTDLMCTGEGYSCAGDRQLLFEASMSQWEPERGRMWEVMMPRVESLSIQLLRCHTLGCAPAEAKKPFAHYTKAHGFV